MTTTPMTPGDPIIDTDEKLSLQHRRQLSALVDGDLAPDQAGFLLRRLGHDAELAGRWQRWQLIGDVLRRTPVATLPDGADAFAARVAAAVSREVPRPAVARKPRWQHVAALAASVAVVAVLVTRPPVADEGLAGAAPAVVTASDVPAASPVPAASQPATVEPVREVSVPQFAEATPELRSPARLDATAATVREPSRIAAAPVPAPAGAPVESPAPAGSTLVLASADAGPSGARPFASPDEPEARPWPRATMPALSRPTPAGRFTVGFDDGGQASYSPSPSFYPFEPQLPLGPALPEAEAETGDPAGNPERTP